MDILAQSDSDGSGAGIAILVVIYLVIFVLWVVGLWKCFDKAGIDGWWAIIPILNTWGIVKMSGKEWWWFLLLFIPCVNIIAFIVVSLAVAERFGKSPAYGIGLWLLPFIFYIILGFGDDQYEPAPVM